MAVSTVYVGTWEEIKAHEKEFVGHRLRVTVEPEPGKTDNIEIAARLERFDKSVAELREIGKRLGPLPDITFTRDDIYPDDPI